MAYIHLKIAGVVLSFSSGNSEFLSRISRTYREFLCAEKPDITIRMAFLSQRDPIAGEPNGVASRTDRWTSSFKGPGLVLLLSRRTPRGRLRILEDIKIFERALRIILSFTLPRFNGFLVHGAAVLSGGRGYVFFGQSGAGKTTLSRISAVNGKCVLTDELAAVRTTVQGVRIFSTPFQGEFKPPVMNREAELSHLFELRKSDRIQQASLVAAPVALLRNMMNFSRNPEDHQRLMNLALEICCRVPAGALYFTRDGNFWDHLEESYALSC
jgi:hypothetical protein